MAVVSRRDLRFVEDVFEMGTGLVLDFSNRAFAEFFDEEFDIDIDDDRYTANGTSKAHRLRTFIALTEPPLVGQVLSRLLELRLLLNSNIKPEILTYLRQLFGRLSVSSAVANEVDVSLYDGLSRQLGFLLEATSGNVFHWSKLPQHSKSLAEQITCLRELSDKIAKRTCKVTVLQEKTIIESAHEAAGSFQALSPVAFQVSAKHGIIWSSLAKTIAQLAKLFPFHTNEETNVARTIICGQDDFSLHFCELVEQLLQFEELPRSNNSMMSSANNSMGEIIENSEAANPVLNEGTEFPATVLFVLLKGLKECTDGPRIPNALAALNDALRDVNPAAFVLSTIAGLILVLPDVASLNLDEILTGLDDAAVGFQLSVGVTHGTVEAVADVDGQINLIGPSINTAARLAASPDNEGLLVHKSYADFADTALGASHWLHRDTRREVLIEGKPQDPSFHCYRGPQTFDAKPLTACLDYKFQSAVLIAYDLPKFSAGDRAQLRKRFTRLAHVFKKLQQSAAMANSTALISPGGDGGVLVVPGLAVQDGAVIASRLRELSITESLEHAEAIAVAPRLGVHYGQICSYVNARGSMRPTGIALFAADDIAGDTLAKKKEGIVITRLIADAITGGSNARLVSEFEMLDQINSGPASTLERFVQRLGKLSIESEPTPASASIPSPTNDGPPVSMFEPVKTKLTSKQRGTEGEPVRPVCWRLSAQPVGAAATTKAKIRRVVMTSSFASDTGTSRQTSWPAVLRPQITKEESRSDGAIIWHRCSDHGASNFLDEEQLGLHGNGTVWFQRASFWDTTGIHVDFGQCCFDALVFLKLMTRVGNVLDVNAYDITLRFEVPVSNIVVTVQTNGVSSMQPARVARMRGRYLEATVKLGPKTSLPDQVIANLAKGLLDGVANECDLGDDVFFGTVASASFLEIDQDSLLMVSRTLS